MTKREYNIAVQEWSHGLYRYALKLMRDEMLADDVVQDAFLKLWTHRKKVDARKAKSWLFSTAHNGMLNQLKRARKSQPIEPERHELPYHDQYRFELREPIDRSLATLPDVQRSIVLLRDLEGYSYQEIGEMLGLNASQVKVYLFRARKKMQSQLKDIYVYK